MKENGVLLAQVQKFLHLKLSPITVECEEEERFPDTVFREFFAQGFGTSFFPESFGGNGDLKEYLNIAEELGKVDLGFALSVLANSILFGNTVLRLGSDGQKQKFLPGIIQGSKIGCWCLTEPLAGSDARNVQTVLVEKADGTYELSGSKTFITNAPVADYFIVISKLKSLNSTSSFGGDSGTVAVLLEKGIPGLSVGQPLKKMGHRSSPTGEVFFERCSIGHDQILGTFGRAFEEVKESLDIERAVLSSIALGAIDELLKIMVRYASERKQFGKPILDFQLIQCKIAEIAAEFELLKVFREYVMHPMCQSSSHDAQISLGAATPRTPSALRTKDAAILKWRISTLGVKAADYAVQILGGYGYMREYKVEKIYRDLKLYEIGGGTNEIQSLIIAKEVKREILGLG